MSKEAKWRWIAMLLTAAGVPAALVAFLEFGRSLSEDIPTSIIRSAGFVVLRPAIPVPPVLRLMFAVLIPPDALPTLDVIIERSLR